MKKILTLILTFMFLLTACTEKTSNVENNTSVEFSAETIDLSNISIYSEKMYQIKPNIKANYAGNIVFSDLNTKQTIYLCNRLECEHKDDSCTSFLNSSSGFITFNYNKDKIIFSDIVQNKEAIYIMDLNGENRQLLYELNADEQISVPYRMTIMENKIYTIIQKPSNIKNGLDYAQYILEINTEDKTYKISDRIKNMSELMGADENNIYLLAMDYDNEGNMKFFINKYNLSDNSQENIYDVSYGEKGAGDLPTIKNNNKNKVYMAYTNDNKGLLKCFDINTKEETVVIDNIDTKYGDALSFGGIYDEYIIFDSVLKDANGYYSVPRKIAVNTLDKSVNDITMVINGEDARNFFVTPVGVYKDKFVVVNSSKIVKYQYTDKDGQMAYADIVYSLYSLINKDDYVTNTENYESIESLI